INASEPVVESRFQTALLNHIRDHAGHLPVPHIVPTLKGDSLADTLSANGDVHNIRLVGWVDGLPLAESARSLQALEGLGELLGQFDAALQGFMHAGALRDLDWDMTNAGRSKDRLHFVKNADD